MRRRTTPARVAALHEARRADLLARGAATAQHARALLAAGQLPLTPPATPTFRALLSTLTRDELLLVFSGGAVPSDFRQSVRDDVAAHLATYLRGGAVFPLPLVAAP